MRNCPTISRCSSATPTCTPTFAQQYTDETVTNNSLVVESGERNRYIGYDDIYQYDTGNYYSRAISE